jgi:hypothetical protein
MKSSRCRLDPTTRGRMQLQHSIIFKASWKLACHVKLEARHPCEPDVSKYVGAFVAAG